MNKKIFTLFLSLLIYSTLSAAPIVEKPRNSFTHDKAKYTISIPDGFFAVEGRDEKEIYFVDRDYERIIHIKVMPFKTFLFEYNHDLNAKCSLKEVESLIKNKFVYKTISIKGDKTTFSRVLRTSGSAIKKIEEVTVQKMPMIKASYSKIESSGISPLAKTFAFDKSVTIYYFLNNEDIYAFQLMGKDSEIEWTSGQLAEMMETFHIN